MSLKARKRVLQTSEVKALTIAVSGIEASWPSEISEPYMYLRD